MAGPWIMAPTGRSSRAWIAVSCHAPSKNTGRRPRWWSSSKRISAAASAGVRPAPQDEWALRDFQAAERTPGKDYESDPLVVVLCSFYDGALAELQAGQALQRVLLTATTLGLSASFMSQAIEVRPVRDELRRTLGGTLEPQTVLRIGFGSPVPASPRRAVRDLLLTPSCTTSTSSD